MLIKRLILIVTVFALMLSPTASAFAQTQPPGPSGCDPELFLNELVSRLTFVIELQDLGDVIMFAAETTSLCMEEWLTMLLGPDIMNMFPPELVPPLPGGGIEDGSPTTSPGNPNDGVMSPEEAEFVLTTAFGGDFATANQYICLAEQLDESDIPPAGSLTLDRVKCAAVEDTMSCSIEGSISGEALNDTVTFQIENGKLCGTIE